MKNHVDRRIEPKVVKKSQFYPFLPKSLLNNRMGLVATLAAGPSDKKYAVATLATGSSDKKYAAATLATGSSDKKYAAATLATGSSDKKYVAATLAAGSSDKKYAAATLATGSSDKKYVAATLAAGPSDRKYVVARGAAGYFFPVRPLEFVPRPFFGQPGSEEGQICRFGLPEGFEAKIGDEYCGPIPGH